MHLRTNRRQVALFLAAVVLPCSLLVLLGWRLIVQEAELENNRRAEERERLTREYGQRLLFRLEHLKLTISGSGPAFAAETWGRPHPDSALAFVAVENAGRIELPWHHIEPDGVVRPEFVAQALEAERLEFGDGSLDRAASAYERLFLGSREAADSAYAQLLLARVQAKLGENESALKRYRSVLALPSTLRDDQRIPFAFYAARSLLISPADHPAVAERLAREVASSRWLPPPAVYMLRSLADSLARQSADTKWEAEALSVRAFSESCISLIEHATRLVRDYPALALRLRESSAAGPLWVPYANDTLFLVGRIEISGDRSAAVVVRADAAGEDLLPPEWSDDARMASTVNGGVLLGEAFPGVALITPPLPQAAGWTMQRTFYASILGLVLGVTLFSGYLLLRDTRREVRLATLRSQFVASVSHELRTPLTAIRMYAETLLMGRRRDEKTLGRYLETILNESERLSRLIGNVLDFSRMEQGSKRYRFAPARIEEVVRSAAEAMAYPLSRHGFDLSVDVDEGIPDVTMDRDAVEEAVINLLSNAVKYSGDARDIRLHVSRHDGKALVSIRDHGIGLAPEDRARIFEKFYRVESAVTEGIPGTGIGLTLAAHVAQAHGGGIRVESAVGSGSTFTLELPIRTAS